MSVLVTSALLNSASAAGGSAASVSAMNPDNAFIQAVSKAGSAGGDQTSAESVSRKVMAPSPESGIAVQTDASPPSSALQAKLEYTGHALAAAKERVGAAGNAATSTALRNRLTLLETQFKGMGVSVQQMNGNANPAELLKLQHDIYQMDEQVEILSKVVEQATSGVKSVLQMQI